MELSKMLQNGSKFSILFVGEISEVSLVVIPSLCQHGCFPEVSKLFGTKQLYYTIGCDLCTSTATSGTLNNLGCSMPQPVLCEPLTLMYDTGIEIWWHEVEALDMGLFSRNSQFLLGI